MPACDVNLRGEIHEKYEEKGEELTEDERAIYEAKTQEELNEAMPDNYGPASEFDGDFCNFCYRMGETGALVMGLAIMSLVTVAGAGVEYFLYGGFIGIVTGIGAVLGFLGGIPVWWNFHKKVRLKGYFPTLGPAFGPKVEWFFSKLGIGITAHARGYGDDLKPSNSAKEELSVETAVSTDDTEIMTEEGFSDRIEEHWDEKMKIKSEKEDLRSQKKHWKSKAERKDERIEDLEATVEGYQNASSVIPVSGKADPDVVWEINIPACENQDKAGNVSFYAMGFTWYAHDTLGDIPLPVGGYEKQTIESMKGSVPDQMDLDDIRKIEGYFPWENPDEAINQKIEFQHTGHPEFEPSKNALIHGHLGDAEELRRKTVSPDTDYVKVSIDCGIDINGNPVPLRGHHSGFEKRQVLKNKANDLERKFNQLNHHFEEQQEHITDLNQKIDLLKKENKNLKNRLEQARQNERTALEGQAANEHTQHVQNDQKEILGKELHREKQKRAILDDRVGEAEKALASGNGSSTHVTEEEAKSEKEQERIEKVEKIREFWVSDEIDHTRLSEDDYEYDHVDFIREFRNTDDDELPKAAKNLKRQLDNPEQVKNGGPA
ncbi:MULTISPECIES: hypothetical protein [Haloarcula]|uniref:hypothetical protein n=1 Tax=Haloarcula TaxID=2237 RepID=UPI0023E75B02|nr:hypothetical protein [Halomicroarcula sp. SHR3]